MKAITQFLENSCRKFPSRTALQIKEGQNYIKWTYRDLFDKSRKLACFLKSLGITKSDRIGLITENTPYWGLSFFAVLWTEAGIVPIDNKLKEHSIAKILEHSECKVIFSSVKFFEMIQGIARNQKIQPLIIVLDDEISGKSHTLKHILSQNPPEMSLTHPDPDSLAIILYTSGTTGSPKGVMLTHANIVSNVEAVSPLYPFTEKDHFVSVLPLCHTYAITADFLIPLEAGAAVTYVENLKGSILMERMQENQGTVLIAVPALIEMMHHQIMTKVNALPGIPKKLFYMLKAVSGFFLKLGLPIGHILFKGLKDRLSPRLRFFISGGAPIDPKILEEFFKLGIPIYQGYGLTETSPILTVNAPENNRIGSAGKMIRGVEIKIENREVVAKGPNVMRGYYKNDEATREVLKDGWFYTGDIGYFDKDGYLYISGRLKNIIVTRGGKNVSPEEVEEELCQSAWIKEACVVGVMKETRGFTGDEQVYALIVPNPEAFNAVGIAIENKKKVEEKIHQEVRSANERLADYKRIRGFEIWDELPKTTTLKIKRKDIRELLDTKGTRPAAGEL